MSGQKEIPTFSSTPGNRGFRKVGGGVIDAFYDGLASVDVNYDFVAKMDVDLEFSPRYLERLLEYFQRDPGLAAASGKVYRLERGRLIEEFMIDEMVAGQFNFTDERRSSKSVASFAKS